MKIQLGSLKKGKLSVITRVGSSLTEAQSDPDHSHSIARLLEMGFLEGSQVEVMHEAPVSKDPIVVKIRGSLVALRRNEANLIEVEAL